MLSIIHLYLELFLCAIRLLVKHKSIADRLNYIFVNKMLAQIDYINGLDTQNTHLMYFEISVVR